MTDGSVNVLGKTTTKEARRFGAGSRLIVWRVLAEAGDENA